MVKLYLIGVCIRISYALGKGGYKNLKLIDYPSLVIIGLAWPIQGVYLIYEQIEKHKKRMGR